MERSATQDTETARPGHFDEFPGPEDWDALQGGRPRIFRNPRRPDSVWQVVHVYEQHSDAKHRFKSGIIVPTLPPSFSPEHKLTMLRKSIVRLDWEGNRIERAISLPSFMDRTLHGDTCQTRSAGYGSGSYDRISNQEEYDNYLEDLRTRGYQELIFGVNNEGFTLNPIEQIAPSKPLKPTTD